MADLVNKFRVQDAIDDLEAHYPEAFEDMNRPLYKDVPANYPAYVTIRKFLAQIEINDRHLEEQERRLGRVKSGIIHYQTVAEIARKTHLSPTVIREYLRANPTLESMYLRKQRERNMILLAHIKTGEQKVFNTPKDAAKFINVSTAFFRKNLKKFGRSKAINGWRPSRLIRGEDKNWNG